MQKTPRSLRTAASAVILATALAGAGVGVILSGSGSVAAEECAIDARFLDPENDVNDLALGPLPGVAVDPALNPDSLDLRAGFLSVNQALDTVTFNLKVTDLGELPGSVRGLGEAYEFGFTLDGIPYYLTAGRLILDPLTITEEYFELGDFGGANGAGRTINANLTGEFDPDFDVITINLSKADLIGSTPAQAAFGDKSRFGDFEVVTRRDLLVVAPDADVAVGVPGCEFVPVPDPTPTPTTPTTTVTATTTATATATATVTGSPTATATTTTTTTATATATRTVTETGSTEVVNNDPVIRKFAAKPLSPENGGNKARVGSPIRFKAKAKDPDGDKLRYRWDLGDGTKKSGRKVFHKYTDEGQYRILVKITDGLGGKLKVRAFLKIGPEKK